MGITVFVVGVGEESDISQSTLETIAGTPSRVFRLTDHDFLVDDQHPRDIRETICNASNLCDPHPCHVNATCRQTGGTFTCTCNVGFTGNGFTCTVVQCPALTAPTNGALSSNRRQYQDQVTFTCNTGYNLVGPTSVTCLISGSWSASPPTCNPVQCPLLTAPSNGAVSPTGQISFPNAVSFTCNSGYVLNGAASAMCQANGQWSNPVHTCTRTPCPVLAAPTNGARTPSTGSNLYQDQISFNCNTGYVLNGVSPLTCQATGTWSNAVPTCTHSNLCSPNPCQRQGTCTVTGPTTFTCTCNQRYSGHLCQYACEDYFSSSEASRYAVYDNMCYWFSPTKHRRSRKYTKARADCVARSSGRGATLALIKDADTQTFVEQYLGTIVSGSRRDYWIGLDDRAREKHFKWNDGTALVYQNWARRRPLHRGKDCAGVMASGKWDLYKCRQRKAYICQMPRVW
ncbi:E-selectin-like [Branchiostoma floridae x Branchiostoma japonicum]